MITLNNEYFQLTLDQYGATILEFTTKAGIPILQTLDKDTLQHLKAAKQEQTATASDQALYTPDETGGFPLLPIANRVKGNQYELNGEVVKLDKNSADGSEYLHGQGWQSIWQVENQSQHQATLSLDFAHPSNGYVYTAKVMFELKEDGLDINLWLKHLGSQPRLYGLGFHPYLAIEPLVDELKLNVTGFCPEIEHHLAGKVSENILPEFDYRSFKPISDSFVNHSYVGFNGLQIKRAALKSATHQGLVSMESDMPFLMMYHMPKSKFLALEPQSHGVDACNQVGRGGLKILAAPFNTLQHQLKIRLH